MKTIHLIFATSLLFFCTTKVAAQTAPDNESAVLNHIAVYVTDLDKSEYFYHSLLNLVKIEEPFKDGKHIWFTLGRAGQMHLIKGETRKVEHDKNEHLCFSVASIPSFITKLDQQKINYSDWPGKPKAVTVRVDGVKQIYFQDPDGHWIEVNDAK